MSNRPARGRARVQAEAMESLKAQLKNASGLLNANELQVKELKKILKRRDLELIELDTICAINAAKLDDYQKEVRAIKEYFGLHLTDDEYRDKAIDEFTDDLRPKTIRPEIFPSTNP